MQVKQVDRRDIKRDYIFADPMKFPQNCYRKLDYHKKVDPLKIELFTVVVIEMNQGIFS